MQIEKISDVKWIIKKEGEMKVPVIIFAKESLLKKMQEDRTLLQAVNSATLPGIVKNMLVMPDGHEGYGFPVGGVAAFDAENGIVSPGAIGFDINCGVRLIKTNLMINDIKPKIKELISQLFVEIPSGVGSKSKIRFNKDELKRISEEGVEFLVQKGFAMKEDLERIEENGRIEGADFSKVSNKAIERGLPEVGSIGAGNHFLEIQKVEKVFDETLAKVFGIQEGQIVVMIHTGSRGFGHQICTDYLKVFSDWTRRKGIKLPDPELVYSELNSKEANDYIAAMKCAVNYAFSNRQIITYLVRKTFEKVFNKSFDALGMEIIYDVAHNIAKLEEHEVDGKRMKLYVHRKGATRAFAKGRNEIPKEYRAIGQPVLIPGSMGTASYLLVGSEGAMKETFGSTCHGAGRTMSRAKAVKTLPARRVLEELSTKGIEVRVVSKELISEEAPQAYKNIDEVVESVEKAGISKIVSRNIPLAVAKG
jgi:tRNA-splicing ligase RtcB